MDRTGGHDRQTPGQPKVRLRVGPQAPRAKLLSEAPPTSLPACWRKPSEFRQAIVTLEHHPCPAVERRLAESIHLTAGAVRQPMEQMDIGIAIQVTRVAIAPGLKDVVELGRSQPIRRRRPGEP